MATWITEYVPLEAGGRGSEAPYDRIFVMKKQTPLSHRHSHF